LAPEKRGRSLADKRFVGRDYEKARYYSEDKKFLLILDPYIRHHEVLVGGAR
jgi:hypothetical protein